MARIVFVGALWPGSTSQHRFDAVRSLGHEVHGISSTSDASRIRDEKLANRVREKLFRVGFDNVGGRDHAGVNQALLREADRQPWDVLWLDKANTVRQETLRYWRRSQPGSVVAAYSPDPMATRRYQSRHFLEHGQYCDVFFTTKGFQSSQLKAMGFERVIAVGNGFDPGTHAPMATTPTDRATYGGEVGFIGRYEPARARVIRYLGRNGISVRVWGPGRWPRSMGDRVKVEKRAIWGGEYRLALNCFDIVLCLLTKVVPEQNTTRSIEIPASGAFMIAERTQEHQALFVEGTEAEFFSSKEELLAKIRHYLANPSQRAEIAAAGRRRCLKSGYSNRDRMDEMLHVSLAIKTAGAAVGLRER